MAVLDAIKKATENFISTRESFADANGNSTNTKQYTTAQMIALFIVVVLWFILVLIVGKYLWNECLCKVVTVCKPTNSIFVILGVILLADLLHPNF